ncbi:MAG: tetratricopeptide repeat protein [Treponemataceae bacterium]|nr:tetratricopeptide repeat protein [Treponemataceae bacterium]
MLENSEKLNNQAIELAAQGFYDEAVACLKRAVIIDKDNYLLWYNLGITYRDSGDLENAKRALYQAYRMNDTDEELLETLTLVSFKLKNFDEAFAFCYESLDLNPLNASSWNNLGVLYFSKSQFSEASEAFETSISINPHYTDAIMNLRDTYYEMGDKKAGDECDEILKGRK